jgi:anti-sigma B factor antagonist
MDADELQFMVAVGGGTDGNVVAPRGELDIATQGQLRAVLEQEAKNGSVTLDLTGLRFMDTSGLRLILETAAAARRDGFTFGVIPGPPAVQRLFEIAGVSELVPFVDAEEGGTP